MKAYIGKTIKYPQSPDGKGYIGTAKLPLMKVKSGFGFLGIKMQDSKRQKLQCHKCGKWFGRLNFHVIYNHEGLDEYRKEFGFSKTASLVSDLESTKLAQRCLGLRSEGVLKPNGLQKGHKPMGAALKGGNQTNTMQFKNQWGTCDEQIKARVINHIKRFRYLPGKKVNNDGKNYKGEHLRVLLIRRFGSAQKAYKIWGLPYVYKREGSIITYKFPDNSTQTVLSRNWEDREKMYNKMLKKCPILQKT